MVGALALVASGAASHCLLVDTLPPALRERQLLGLSRTWQWLLGKALHIVGPMWRPRLYRL